MFFQVFFHQLSSLQVTQVMSQQDESASPGHCDHGEIALVPATHTAAHPNLKQHIFDVNDVQEALNLAFSHLLVAKPASRSH